MTRTPTTSTLFPYTTLFRSDNFVQTKNDPWTPWTHAWSPKEPGTYSIRLTVRDPGVRTRRLDSGYYVRNPAARSEEHTSELQSPVHLVCRLLLEKKKTTPRS